MDKMRQWSMLTVVAIAAVLAAGWFLLVSPQRAKVASLKAQAASVQQTNRTLQTSVQMRLAEQKTLTTKQAQLQKFATQIPDNPALPALVRQLTDAATGSGVQLVSISPAPPTLLVPAAPAGVAGGTVSNAVKASTGTPTTSTGAAPVAPPAPGTVVRGPAGPQLAEVPVTISVSGGYYNIEQFFEALEGLPRALLVSGLSICPSTTTGAGSGGTASGVSCSAASAGGGAAAYAPGELVGSITARVFMTAAQASGTSPLALSTTPAK